MRTHGRGGRGGPARARARARSYAVGVEPRVASRVGSPRVVGAAGLLSVLAHVAILGGAASLVLARLRSFERPLVAFVRELPRTELELELLPLEVVPSPAEGAAAEPVVAALARGGGEGVPRPDTGRAGRGGEATTPKPAVNLADQDDRVTLVDSVLSRLDRSQHARIRVSKVRASRENWRASRDPMELTFLTSGDASEARAERRPRAASDPSRGAWARGSPAARGAALGEAPRPDGVGEARRAVGADVRGGERSSAGLGVRDGASSTDARASAEQARARPLVSLGTPSVASFREGKPSDTLDSEQEVAEAMKAFVHASTMGGRKADGVGGEPGKGAPGAGGREGPGAVSNALGTGKGPGVDNPARALYVRQVLAKVHPLWANAFPRSAALEGRGGETAVRFTILSDGSVTGVTVSRASGIPEFDENCRRAVVRAAPFPPLPRELGSSLTWTLPFVVQNPAVRPKDPKNGPL
jgi:TonB family protein